MLGRTAQARRRRCACSRRSCRRHRAQRPSWVTMWSQDPEGVRKNLGFYSATTALYPRLTTRETIDFFARINQYPADTRQAASRVSDPTLRSCRKYADARIEKLSSGMKQKVSIARTIAHNPADPDFRRTDSRTRRIERSRCHGNHQRTARGRQNHHFFNAHHERSRASLRSDCHHPRRTYSRL